MGKPSHIPLFPDAYHRDTTHLTTEEHGAYLLLLMAAWGTDDCTLPNDERRLAALAQMPVPKWRKIAPTVLEFWTIDKGRISQKRLLKEWQYVRQTKAKRADAARAKWNKSSDANALHMDMQNRADASAPIGGGGGVGVIDSYPTYPREGFVGDNDLEGVVRFPTGGAK